MAALNLVIDFDFIEEGAEKGMPKYLEYFWFYGIDGNFDMVIFRNIKAA